MSNTADIIVSIDSPVVCTCGCDVSQVVQKLKERRQVFDLPQPKLEVTEYQQFVRRCPLCKTEISNKFPIGVKNHVQYGNGAMAMGNLLGTGFHLSIQNTAQSFLDLYGQSLNTATVLNANRRVYKALESTETL